MSRRVGFYDQSGKCLRTGVARTPRGLACPQSANRIPWVEPRVARTCRCLACVRALNAEPGPGSVRGMGEGAGS
jgi:hypothetical protein